MSFFLQDFTMLWFCRTLLHFWISLSCSVPVCFCLTFTIFWSPCCVVLCCVCVLVSVGLHRCRWGLLCPRPSLLVLLPRGPARVLAEQRWHRGQTQGVPLPQPILHVSTLANTSYYFNVYVAHTIMNTAKRGWVLGVCGGFSPPLHSGHAAAGVPQGPSRRVWASGYVLLGLPGQEDEHGPQEQLPPGDVDARYVSLQCP